MADAAVLNLPLPTLGLPQRSTQSQEASPPKEPAAGAGAGDEGEGEEHDVASLSVKQLQGELKKLELSESGKKAELVERLTSARKEAASATSSAKRGEVKPKAKGKEKE